MQREICSTCKRPPSVCYCSTLVTIDSKIKVIIIQHPREESHPFNTGRMTHLCLPNSELLVTDRVSEEELEILLGENSALLYPSLPWMSDSETLPHETRGFSANGRAIERLVVIDATWRKSRKFLHEHTLLQSLPRITIASDYSSNYRIRRSSIHNGLSTIESTAIALEMIESSTGFRELLRPFEGMVTLQLAAAGASKGGHK